MRSVSTAALTPEPWTGTQWERGLHPALASAARIIIYLVLIAGGIGIIGPLLIILGGGLYTVSGGIPQ